MRTRIIGLAASAALAIAALSPASAQVLIGTQANSNCIPFGCQLGTGTYYQQVYSSTAFSGAGLISGIDFFDNPEFAGTLNDMSFTLSLSTTTLGLNVDNPGGISSSNPNFNVGADAALFGTFSIGGAVPSILSFTGTPFFYDPSLGNLLLDLRVTSLGTHGSGTFLYSSGDEAGVTNSPDFSRSTDFGVEFTGWGLQTQFDYSPNAISTTPEPATMSLMAFGLVGLGSLRRRRRKA